MGERTGSITKLRNTSKEQYKLLVDILLKEPEAGRDYDKREQRPDTRGIWEYIKEQLNELGPPVKDVKTWKRVWQDYKIKVRKIIEKNKTLEKNKRIPLSPMQRKISKILYGHLTNEENNLDFENSGNYVDSDDENESSKNYQSEDDDENSTSLESKVSSKEQLCKLVSMLEKEPLIARGIIKKRDAYPFWKEVETKLNKIGISRSLDKWTRAWASMKRKLRHKLIQNNITDIDSVDAANLFLSNLEERMLKFIDLSKNKNKNDTQKYENRQSKSIVKNEQNSPKYHSIKYEEMETENFIDEENAENMLDEDDNNFDKDSFETDEEIQFSNEELSALDPDNLFVTEQDELNNRSEIKEVKRLLNKISEDIKHTREMKRKHYDEILKIERKKLQMYEKEMEEKSRVNKLTALKLNLEIKNIRLASEKIN